MTAAHRLKEEAELQEALDAVSEGLDSEVDILFNDPADGLLAAARHVDLLVMGSRGRGPRARRSSAACRIRSPKSAPCPVLILPRS